jgi:quinol monooxygenase YgiN
MIFIVVKWPVKPEHADTFPQVVQDFTSGVRAEPGNIFFEWSRSVEDPNSYVLVEAFADGDAAAAHVAAQHFKDAVAMLPDYVTATPEIINVEIPDASGWSQMAEVQPR